MDDTLQKQKIVVSGVLINKNNQILLAKRPMNKKIAPGIYHLPGGHVEFGETLEEALVREMEEEFDLKISVGKILNSFSYGDDKNHTIGVTFVMYFENQEPSKIHFDAKDTEEIVWVSENNFQDFLKKFDHDYISISKYYGIEE